MPTGGFDGLPGRPLTADPRTVAGRCPAHFRPVPISAVKPDGGERIAAVMLLDTSRGTAYTVGYHPDAVGLTLTDIWAANGYSAAAARVAANTWADRHSADAELGHTVPETLD